MKRPATIAFFVLVTFVFFNYLEFHYWFFNNELPAYLRSGVLHGDAAGAVRVFYQAARDACSPVRPDLVENCQEYQLALMADVPYVRPLSSMAGVLLTRLSAHVEFMQALKFAIIALAIGGAVVCGLLLAPFLARLEGRTLAAIAVTWFGGWFATRLLPSAGSATNVLIIAFAIVVLLLAALSLRSFPSISRRFTRRAWPGAKPAAEIGLQVLAIALCFALGYRASLIVEARFPLLYLALAIASWPLLHRGLPNPGHWILSGFLAAALYISIPLMTFLYSLSLSKLHQIYLVVIILFFAIWRDDTRVYWVLPLVLLFDMQNGARLAILIIIAESLLAVTRRKAPEMHAMAPATLTAIVGLTVTITTAYYPFQRLYNFSDAVGVLTTPIVLIAGLIALATVWATRRLRSPNTGSQVALDRTFVYAASVVAIVGIWIATWGLMFDAFQLSSFYGSVAAAPAMTLFFVTVALLMTSLDEESSDARRWSAVASIAALLLLMTTSKGRTISLSQLNEGVRSSIGRHMPADWSRHTPFMTLDDNTVYLDMDNPSTSALMQYSVIKILLLSRSAVFSPDKLVVRSFSRYGR